MRIIPVLDLKNGRVVRGVAGRREEYRPIESLLCVGSDVAAVAGALRRFGFDTCYLADLDAIAGNEPNFQAFDNAVHAGFRLWIDAGTGTPEAARQIAGYLARRSNDGRIVVGLESVPDERSLKAVVAAIGERKVVFSLDLKAGLPLTTSPDWRRRSPAEIADRAVELGIRSIIVLDLAGVGVGQGVPTLDLCRRLRSVDPTLEIVTGGGVRSIDDLSAVRDAGCDAALVASALHDGRITAAGLAREDFLHG